jgi:hypothetical protein
MRIISIEELLELVMSAGKEVTLLLTDGEHQTYVEPERVYDTLKELTGNRRWAPGRHVVASRSASREDLVCALDAEHGVLFRWRTGGLCLRCVEWRANEREALGVECK